MHELRRLRMCALLCVNDSVHLWDQEKTKKKKDKKKKKSFYEERLSMSSLPENLGWFCATSKSIAAYSSISSVSSSSCSRSVVISRKFGGRGIFLRAR